MRVGERNQTYYEEANLVNLLFPSRNGGWRDIVRAGWKPALYLYGR